MSTQSAGNHSVPTMLLILGVACALLVWTGSFATASAQPAATPAQGAAGDQQPGAGAGRGGGGFSQPGPSDWNDHEGWVQIFDGETLNNWNCDPDIWKVVDGAITAVSTPENPVGTTYCTWMGGEPADFELKAEFRILEGGNSGIQYRSWPSTGRRGGPPGGFGGAAGRGGAGGAAAQEPAPVTTALAPLQPCQIQVPVMYPQQARGRGPGPGAARGQGGARAAGPGGPGREPSPYDVGGYQFDASFDGGVLGQLYENGMRTGAPEDANSRGIVTYRGQIVQLLEDGRRETIGCTDNGTSLKGVMNIGGWNYFHIIARGPVLIHIVNGYLTSLTIDDDPVRQKLSGRIAVQIEGQGEVNFRNLWLKNW